MKHIARLSLSCVIVFSLSVSALPKAANTITIPHGTLVDVELTAAVTSEQYLDGSIIGFTVVQPVKVNGVTVIERGAPAKARVTKVTKAGRWGKGGNIAWVMQDVMAVDGSRVRLKFSEKLKGNSAHSTVIAAGAATSLVIPFAGLLWGLKKGSEVTISAGRRFEALVDGDAVVSANAPTVAPPAQVEASTVRPAITNPAPSATPKRMCARNGYRVPCPEDKVIK